MPRLLLFYLIAQCLLPRGYESANVSLIFARVLAKSSLYVQYFYVYNIFNPIDGEHHQ
jgi:hypothetical protein